MKHGVFTVASALSLLLCGAVALLCVRSYWIGDSLQIVRSIPTPDSFIRRETNFRAGRGVACIATAVSETTYAQMRQHNIRPYSYLDTIEWTTSRPAQVVTGSWYTNQSPNFGLAQWDWSLAGWRIHHATVGDGFWGWNVFVPLWQVVILTALLPVVWVHRTRRNVISERRRKGQCGACGYDLTGNTSGVCPECGIAVSCN